MRQFFLKTMLSKLISPAFSDIESDHARFDAWRGLLSSLFIAEKNPETIFSREIFVRCHNLDRLLFFEQSAGAHRAERSQSQITTQGIDHILLGLQTVGVTRLMRPDGDAAIQPGDFFVFDLAQQFRLMSESMSSIHVCIPRRRFERQVGKMSAYHMQIFASSGDPLFRLMADHLLNMRACLACAEAEQRTYLTAAALAICNAAFTPCDDSAYNHPSATAIQIRQFIEDNIQRPDLGIDLLRERFGLSRTPLYNLFEADGGVASYIRNRRLARAMLILTGVERGPQQRVSSVAYACGYQSEKMFSRAFRRRYSVNPRDVNKTFRTVAVQEKGALLASWIQNL
ncbi:helix-turn-helix domain-containing protein [Boseaceae bacterium BT-24-1]|nr:helix-turn-helix domain-containing protein [Boseaceae bacterium BT-24-1]